MSYSSFVAILHFEKGESRLLVYAEFNFPNIG